MKTRKKKVFQLTVSQLFLVSAIVVLCFHTDDNIMVKDALDFFGGNFPKILSGNLFCIFLFEWRKMEKRERERERFFKKKTKICKYNSNGSFHERQGIFFCQINQ